MSARLLILSPTSHRWRYRVTASFRNSFRHSFSSTRSAASTKTPFVHEPILTPRTIRLFNLRSDVDKASPLRGSFEVHHLRPRGEDSPQPQPKDEAYGPDLNNNLDSRPYIALSYTWQLADEPSAEEASPSDESHTIHVEDDGRVIHITPNLNVFLRMIRDTETDQRLWIDQLCIRQDDGDTSSPTDKEQQIPLMRDIYAQAIGAFLWTGDDAGDTEGTEAILALATALSRFYIASFQTEEEIAGIAPTRPVPKPGLRADEDMLAAGFPTLRDPIWMHLSDFLERRVFSRLWILQEVVTAREVLVVCGNQWIDLDVLGCALAALEKTEWDADISVMYGRERPETVFPEKTVPAMLKKIMATSPGVLCLTTTWIQRAMYNQGTRQTIEDLLISTRWFRTDRRFMHDKVYALLGLAADADQVGGADDSSLPDALVPNYKKTGYQVYQEVTEYCLSKGSLEILSAVEDRCLRPADSPLPSWVPDFSLMATNTGFGLPPIWPSSEDSASETQRSSPASIRANGQTLILESYEVDSIRTTQHVEPEDLVHPEDRLEAVAQLIGDPAAPYADGTESSRLDALWRTLAVDNLNHPKRRFWIHHFADYVLTACAARRLRSLCPALVAEGLMTPHQASHFAYIAEDPKLFDLVCQRMADTGGRDGGPVVWHRNKRMGVSIPFPAGMIYEWAPGLHRIVWEGLVPVLGQRFWEDLRGEATSFEYQFIAVAGMRRFFVSEKGLYGLGPISAVPGDGVFIFKAGGIPFVLRGGAGGEESRTIVGGCYLHGTTRAGIPTRADIPWTSVHIR